MNEIVKRADTPADLLWQGIRAAMESPSSRAPWPWRAGASLHDSGPEIPGFTGPRKLLWEFRSFLPDGQEYSVELPSCEPACSNGAFQNLLAELCRALASLVNSGLAPNDVARLVGTLLSSCQQLMLPDGVHLVQFLPEPKPEALFEVRDPETGSLQGHILFRPGHYCEYQPEVLDAAGTESGARTDPESAPPSAV